MCQEAASLSGGVGSGPLPSILVLCPDALGGQQGDTHEGGLLDSTGGHWMVPMDIE